MKNDLLRVECNLEDGRKISIETGRLARQADGAVVVRCEDTMILATVVASKKAKEGIDFLPLTVDYREKFSSSGKFPGGFIKREGRPSDNEILTMRLVDRVLRPLFPKDYHCEVQIMLQLISYDGKILPDSLVGLASSAALAVSDIPFNDGNPISEVRVARINNEFVINPNREDLKEADIDIMIGASAESVVMVEGEMKEVSEKEMIEAIQFGHEEIKRQIDSINKLCGLLPKKEIRSYDMKIVNEELKKKVFDTCQKEIFELVKASKSKQERTAEFKEIEEKLLSNFNEEELEESESNIKSYFSECIKETVRNFVLDDRKRIDGRKTDEIRDIWCEVDYLPSVHGSAVFTRGETQALATVTLGTLLDANSVDDATYEDTERFYLHYNFPPFSTGEARPIRGVSRREIGHGNLAQRALKNLIPKDNPYTIRLVSDILESNGSSSMATVCSGTLALMDSGVGIDRPVSGIAMGLILDENTGKYAVLSDILGDEDHLGDMDFKITGTEKGITACQMDIKIKGLTYNILEEALNQAKEGRNHILAEMLKVLPETKSELKEYAPKIIGIEIPKEMIGAVIGPGGKVIQKLQAETETTITIEEVGKIGKVEILGKSQELIDRAIQEVESLTFIPKVGEVYEVVVKSILAFGLVVELSKGTETLLHISEIEWRRIETLEGMFEVGDVMEVKLLDIDPRSRKLKVSRKVLLERPEKK